MPVCYRRVACRGFLNSDGVFGSVPKIETFSSLSGVWIAAGLSLDDSISVGRANRVPQSQPRKGLRVASVA